MYPYHNQIIKRIKNGELTDIIPRYNHHTIGDCTLLVFSTAPFTRPIRPHALYRYADVLPSALDKVCEKCEKKEAKKPPL